MNVCSYIPLKKIEINTDGINKRFKILFDEVCYLKGSAPGTGTVTSVGLTFPSPSNPAFSVSGSPITNNGTLAVTANGTSSEVILGDGSLAYPSSVDVYNVFNYGATADGIIISDANITSGSANLTTTTTVFTNADIGKYIQVQAADTGGYAKVFTITAVGGPNSITLNTTAGATVTNGVAKYGTDQTPFIQAAIDAAVAGYAGTVYFPKGIYVLAGALQSPSNSQLTFPFIDNPTTYGGHSAAITLQGESCGGKETTVLAVTVPSSSGTTLLSFAIGTGSFPSIIATRTVDTTQYTYVDLTVKDMNLQVIGNTSTGAALCALNLGNFINAQVENLNIQVDVPLVNSILPTNNYAAIIFPQYGFASIITAQDIQVSGFRHGFIFGEHFRARNAQAFGCYYGFSAGTSGGHPVVISGMAHWCKYSMASTINYPTSRPLSSNWIYADMAFEGLNEGARWYNYTNTIYDPSNFLVGKLNYKFSTSSVGTPTTFSKSGGANFQCISIPSFIVTSVNSVNADVNGNVVVSSSGSPGGSTTQLQYNNAGAFGGVSGATTDGTNIFAPILYGGSAANDDITIHGTSNATRTTSYVNLQPSGGYVGIGTSTPSYPLHVVSSFNTQLVVQGTTSSAGQGAFYLTNDRAAFATYGGFLIGSSAGNIGNLFGVSRADKLFMFADGASNLGMYVGTLQAQPFVIGTNNVERLRVNSTGEVSIGGTAVTSGLLDLQSTSKGLLVPRMTNTQRNAISSPATSLMIYQTDGTAGFYYYNGAAWTLVGQTAADPLIYEALITETGGVQSATVLKNTIGTTFTITSPGAGVLRIDADAGTPFTSNKTLVYVSMNSDGGGTGIDYTSNYDLPSADRVTVFTYSGGTATANIANKMTVKIVVYP